MGVLGTENDELSGPDPDEKLRPVCKKPNVFFRIERPPGDTALPTLPPTHRFDFAGNQYLYVDIFIVHLQRNRPQRGIPTPASTGNRPRNKKPSFSMNPKS